MAAVDEGALEEAVRLLSACKDDVEKAIHAVQQLRRIVEQRQRVGDREEVATSLLLLTPSFADLYNVLDVHAKGDAAGRICIPLLVVLARVLTCHVRTRSAAGAQLDAVARTLLQSSRLRGLYALLASGIQVRANAVLMALTAAVCRGGRLPREVLDSIDWGMKCWSRLARPLGRGGRRADDNRGIDSAERAARGKLGRPTREVLQELTIALLRCGDDAALRTLVSQEAPLQLLLKSVASDPPEQAASFLVALRMNVLPRTTSIPPRLQVAMYGDGILQQLAELCEEEEPDDGGSDSAASKVASLAHGILMDLYGSIRLAKEGQDDFMITDGVSPTAISATSTHGKRLLRFLLRLKALSSKAHEKILFVAVARMSGTAEYLLREYNFALEPRLSARWLKSVHMFSKVVAMAERDYHHHHHLNSDAVECRPTNVIPTIISRQMLSRGLLSSSILIRYHTAQLVLVLVRDRLKPRLDSRIYTQDAATNILIEQAATQLPDPQTLIKALSISSKGLSPSENEGTDALMRATLVSARFLQILEVYYQVFPRLMQSGNFDSEKILAMCCHSTPPIFAHAALKVFVASDKDRIGVSALLSGIQIFQSNRLAAVRGAALRMCLSHVQKSDIFGMNQEEAWVWLQALEYFSGEDSTSFVATFFVEAYVSATKKSALLIEGMVKYENNDNAPLFAGCFSIHIITQLSKILASNKIEEIKKLEATSYVAACLSLLLAMESKNSNLLAKTYLDHEEKLRESESLEESSSHYSRGMAVVVKVCSRWRAPAQSKSSRTLTERADNGNGHLDEGRKTSNLQYGDVLKSLLNWSSKGVPENVLELFPGLYALHLQMNGFPWGLKWDDAITPKSAVALEKQLQENTFVSYLPFHVMLSWALQNKDTIQIVDLWSRAIDMPQAEFICLTRLLLSYLAHSTSSIEEAANLTRSRMCIQHLLQCLHLARTYHREDVCFKVSEVIASDLNISSIVFTMKIRNPVMRKLQNDLEVLVVSIIDNHANQGTLSCEMRNLLLKCYKILQVGVDELSELTTCRLSLLHHLPLELLTEFFHNVLKLCRQNWADHINPAVERVIMTTVRAALLHISQSKNSPGNAREELLKDFRLNLPHIANILLDLGSDEGCAILVRTFGCETETAGEESLMFVDFPAMFSSRHWITPISKLCLMRTPNAIRLASMMVSVSQARWLECGTYLMQCRGAEKLTIETLIELHPLFVAYFGVGHSIQSKHEYLIALAQSCAGECMRALQKRPRWLQGASGVLRQLFVHALPHLREADIQGLLEEAMSDTLWMSTRCLSRRSDDEQIIIELERIEYILWMITTILLKRSSVSDSPLIPLERVGKLFLDRAFLVTANMVDVVGHSKDSNQKLNALEGVLTRLSEALRALYRKADCAKRRREALESTKDKPLHLVLTIVRHFLDKASLIDAATEVVSIYHDLIKSDMEEWGSRWGNQFAEDCFPRIVSHSIFVPSMLKSIKVDQPLPDSLRRFSLPLTSIVAYRKIKEREVSGGKRDVYEGKKKEEGDAISPDPVISLCQLLRKVLSLRSKAKFAQTLCADPSGHLKQLLLCCYSATNNRRDRELLSLISQIQDEGGDQLGTNAQSLYRHLWGNAARQARERNVANETNEATGKSSIRTLELSHILQSSCPIEPRRVALATLYFPRSRGVFLAKNHGADECVHQQYDQDGANKASSSLEDVEESDTALVDGYDPAFLLPFALFAIESGLLTSREISSYGILSLACVSLSSNDVGMRKTGYSLLAKYVVRAQDEYFREKPQLMLLLSALRKAIPDPFAQLPSITCMFCAEAIISLHFSNSEVYPYIYRLLQKEEPLDLLSIPLFSKLMGSGAVEHHTHRAWMVRLVTAGARDAHEADQIILRRGFNIELFMSASGSSLFDSHIRRLMLFAIDAVCQLPFSAGDLSHHAGLTHWLADTIVKFALQSKTSFTKQEFDRSGPSGILLASRALVSTLGLLDDQLKLSLGMKAVQRISGIDMNCVAFECRIPLLGALKQLLLSILTNAPHYMLRDTNFSFQWKDALVSLSRLLLPIFTDSEHHNFVKDLGASGASKKEADDLVTEAIRVVLAVLPDSELRPTSLPGENSLAHGAWCCLSAWCLIRLHGVMSAITSETLIKMIKDLFRKTATFGMNRIIFIVDPTRAEVVINTAIRLYDRLPIAGRSSAAANVVFTLLSVVQSAEDLQCTLRKYGTRKDMLELHNSSNCQMSEVLSIVRSALAGVDCRPAENIKGVPGSSKRRRGVDVGAQTSSKRHHGLKGEL